MLAEFCTIPMNDLLPSSYNGVVAEDTVVVLAVNSVRNNTWTRSRTRTDPGLTSVNLDPLLSGLDGPV